VKFIVTHNPLKPPPLSEVDVRGTWHTPEIIPGRMVRGSIMTEAQMAAQYTKGPLVPQERPNHYGHLVQPFKLSDGTGISRMKVADIDKQMDEMIAARRKTSPVFPSHDEAQRRRRTRIENFVGRALMAVTVAGVALMFFHDVPFPISLSIAGSGALGFTIACFIAGSRHDAERSK
jgi:hypothetical protein